MSKILIIEDEEAIEMCIRDRSGGFPEYDPWK